MPSKSPAQARLFAAVAHNPAFAKKVGIPVSVGRDFNQADKGTGILEGPRPAPPTKTKTPVHVGVKKVHVGVKKVGVKAPHVSYKSVKTPNSLSAKVLGLDESSQHLLMRGR
jgi:hypothetical protein